MMAKPNMTPHVPEWGYSLMLLSGMRSSATTKIMAPAAKPSIQGCSMATCEASM